MKKQMKSCIICHDSFLERKDGTLLCMKCERREMQRHHMQNTPQNLYIITLLDASLRGICRMRDSYHDTCSLNAYDAHILHECAGKLRKLAIYTEKK